MSTNNQALNVVTYNGSLTTGTPVVLNPQLDRNGMVADHILIASSGTTPVSFRYTAGPLEGTVFVLIPGALFQFPGPLTTCELSGLTGTGYYVIMSQGVGNLPSIQMTSSGGGGGGGGTTNVQVLYAGAPDSNAPNGIQIANLQADQTFNRDESSSATNHISQPLSLAANWGTQTVAPGGGIGISFDVMDVGGNKTYGAFDWVLNGTSNLTELVFVGYQGNEFARWKMPLGSQRNGLHFTNSGGHARAVLSDSDLYLGSLTDLYLTAGSVDQVRVTGTGLYMIPTTALIKGSLNLTVQSNASGTLSLLNSLSNGGVLITDTSVTLGLNSHSWILDTNGDITGPGGIYGEIKSLHDGTTPQSAATVNQLTNAVSGLSPSTSVALSYMTFGATTTGVISDSGYLWVGGGFAPFNPVNGSLTQWVAVAPGKFQSGRIIYDVPPAAAAITPYQLCIVYKNFMPVMTVQIPASLYDTVSLQVNGAVSGDIYSYTIGTTTYGPYTVAPGDTDNDVAAALVALGAADPDYNIIQYPANTVLCTAKVAGSFAALPISGNVVGTGLLQYSHDVVGFTAGNMTLLSGTPFNFIAGDVIGIGLFNQADPLCVGAQNVLANCAFTNS